MKRVERMTMTELLADAAWVRRVATALVREPADAEDVAQLTLVSALERPPLTAGESRPWLRTVARNWARLLGRRSERRQRREAQVESEVVPSPESLVERAQLQRQVATLLSELDEPFRATVLLCYFEELTPSQIAQRLGIPAGTVRWRLKKGLDQLRTRLDRLHGNRRAAWLLPMTTWQRTTPGAHALSASLKGMTLMANKSAIAAGLGALAATTALVGVYEGHAVVERHAAAHAAQATRTNASGASAADATPALGGLAKLAARLPPPSAGATREELLRRDLEQRSEIARLNATIERMSKHDMFGMPASWKHGDDFIRPQKDELQEMAKNCQVRWDSPQLAQPPATMDDDLASEAGVSDDERREFDRVTAEFTQAQLAQVRSAYVEVTGDKAGADTLSPDAMMNEIEHKVPDAVAQQAYWNLSHERAGLIPAPSDPSAASAFERYLRTRSGAGDAFEGALASAIGAGRAHALRTEQGAWGTRFMLGSCPKSSSR